MERFLSRSILLITLIVLAAFSYRALSVGAAELPTIDVGLPDDGVFGLGGHYLVDKGLDRKNGFVMKPRWSGVAEVERLLAIGAIPVGLSTSESALRANIRGIHIRLIQPFMTPHNSILVRKQSPYKNLFDLKGKPFAVPPEVTSAYNNFDYFMRKQGVQIEKYFQLKKLGAAGISAVLEEMNRQLNTKIKLLGWLGALDSWVDKNPNLIPVLRKAWQEAIAGFQEDESHFRKHAKKLFGLEKPEELEIGWPRTRQFILPPDFPWPDKANMETEKRYLKEGVELGIFPSEGLAVVDKLFVP
ncbi:MAG: ABC transporter substrate-binding protein [Deltaproteobacteria bacterium]|nr:ABC transporter substrate-binding protein [Deltaproteobacteria bacterium]